jgi:glycosyltransferase involved in cell wall biosynthesis
MTVPTISICIPAYKRVDYLRRLLESILEQDYHDFEVVLTDDSPDTDVQDLIAQFAARLPILYYKNTTALGTPENWNEGIRRASGTWIKVMHDDDWFQGTDSLGKFASAALANPDVNFIFSAYTNVYEKDDKRSEVRLGAIQHGLLKRSLWYLLGANYVGNPSCTLFRNHKEIFFDPAFKWVVDFEFYIRYLNRYKGWYYIDSPLIYVGMNDTQVTNYTFGVVGVQVPENHQLLIKNGVAHLKEMVVYDYFWRLYRNLNITSEYQIREAGYTAVLPRPLSSMIRWQSRIPRFVLKNGLSSKLLMGLHYMFHSRSI